MFANGLTGTSLRHELRSQKRQAARARTSRLVGAARRLDAVRPTHTALLKRDGGVDGPAAAPLSY